MSRAASACGRVVRTSGGISRHPVGPLGKEAAPACLPQQIIGHCPAKPVGIFRRGLGFGIKALAAIAAEQAGLEVQAVLMQTGGSPDRGLAGTVKLVQQGPLGGRLGCGFRMIKTAQCFENCGAARAASSSASA